MKGIRAAVCVFGVVAAGAASAQVSDRETLWALCGEHGRVPASWDPAQDGCPAEKLPRGAKANPQRFNPVFDGAEFNERASPRAAKRSQAGRARAAEARSRKTSKGANAKQTEFSEDVRLAMSAPQGFSASITWPGSTLSNPALLVVGAPAVLDASDASASWHLITPGAMYGEGSRVNVVFDAPGENAAMACSGDDCVVVQVAVEDTPSASRLELTSIVELADYGYGRVLRFQGTVENPSDDLSVSFFKHTDVFYRDHFVTTVAPDGTFSADLFLMWNVDRVIAVATDPDLDLDAEPGCTATWCNGVNDPLTSQRVPLLSNGTTIFARDAFYALSPMSEAVDPAIHNLSGRFSVHTVGGPNQPAKLLRTHLDSDIFFIYGQATSAIAFIHAGHQLEAEHILNALANLQHADGSWDFVVDAFGNSATSGDFRYSGAVGWVLMAFSAYRLTTGLPTYDATLEAGLTYLSSLMRPALGSRGVRFNPTDLEHTPWDETTLVAFEHNADFYAAARGYELATGDTRFSADAEAARQLLLELWNGEYFYPGYREGAGINTVERYLDTQAWGLLALGASAVYAPGLEFNCRTFFESSGILGTDRFQLHGFFDYTTEANPSEPFVWVEGSASQLLAMNEMERVTGPLACEGFTRQELEASLFEMTAHHGDIGGAPHASLSDGRFPTSSHATSTAWMYLMRHGANPFRPWEWQ